MKKHMIYPLKRIVAIALFGMMMLSVPQAKAQIVFGNDSESGTKNLGIDGENDDVIDSSKPAPINGLIGLGLLVGAYFGYRKLKK